MSGPVDRRALLDDFPVEGMTWGDIRKVMDADRRAAREAALAEVREAVEGLPHVAGWPEYVTRAAVLALLAAAPPAAREPGDGGLDVATCTNCHHGYAEHTGRSLRPYGMPRLPSGLGPPELRPGQCCEHLQDALHTCPCPQFFTPSRPAEGSAE